ncbi:hypothetical protein B0T20DRAFT_108774 [Sordaria brevicollis]|uniref:Uncharacterized protein n=1 Tax=Sordaria brevicollis TaxID=83679 RepID=A0AAE0NUU0_SORBR|nr:hypothetical protein B0T20DRAFT_108774 [Sordaria brevicollis]
MSRMCRHAVGEWVVKKWFSLAACVTGSWLLWYANTVISPVRACNPGGQSICIYRAHAFIFPYQDLYQNQH